MCYNRDMSKKVCFIGHRRIGFGDIRKKLKEVILQKIKDGCKFFTMGTHGDFDKLALSVCRELRHIYKEIKIEVVITNFKSIEPIIDHDEIFGDEKYTPYEDVETIMYNIEETHYKRQIIESNHQMIDSCDTLICYVNKKHNPSGAKLAMNYAKRKALKIINLYNEKEESIYVINKQKKECYDNLWESIKKK